jgi:hypothetical protein
MATIDPNIALGVKPLQLDNPMNAFAQAQQIQAYQRQNELANRAIQQEDALNKAYASSMNPQTGEIDANRLRQNIAGANLGSKLPAVEKSLLDTRKTRGEVEAKEFDLRIQKANKAVKDIASFGTREEILADIQRNIDAGNIDPTKGRQIATSVPQDPAKLPAWQLQTLRGILDAKDQLEQQFTSQDFGGGTRVISTPKYGGGPAQVVQGSQVAKTATPGELLTNARAQENIKIAQENQRREADPVFQQTLSEAKALGQNMAKDKVLRAAQLPKVLDTAEMTLSEIDALIGKRDKDGNLLKGQAPHPGFETAVGATYLPGARFVPGTSASDFQSRFDQVKGGAFLQAFETLKGGGSITNVEGDKGTAALNRMSLAQSEKEFVQAAREFQGIVRKGMERASKLAGAPVLKGAGDASAGEVDTSNPLLKP